MKSLKYDYWVKTKELTPSLGKNKFSATAEIHEIGGDKVEHNLGEVWGETREEVNSKMKTKIEQWIQVNEK